MKLIIFGLHTRCGTTSLIKSFAQSSSLEMYEEPFNHGVNERLDRPRYEQMPFEESYKILSDKYDGIKTFMMHPKHTRTHDETFKYNEKLIKKSPNVIMMYRSRWVWAHISEHMSWSYSRIVYPPKYIWQPEQLTGEERNKFFSMKRPPINITGMIAKYNHVKEYKQKYEKIGHRFVLLDYDKYFSDHSINAVFKSTVERLGADILNDKWKTLLSPDRKMNNEEMYEKLIPNYSKVIEYGEELIL